MNLSILGRKRVGDKLLIDAYRIDQKAVKESYKDLPLTLMS